MTSTQTSIDWTAVLVDQAAWHWTNQLRPRFEGLTDEEYVWEPTPGAWNVHPRGEGSTETQGGSGELTIDWAYPEPVPAPMRPMFNSVSVTSVTGVPGERVTIKAPAEAVDVVAA